MSDLYQEHDFHTSEDWDRLKDECSECYKEIMHFRETRSIADIALHNLEVLSSSRSDYYIANRDSRN